MKKNKLLSEEKNRHLTLKVILGYVLSIAIAFGAIFYILNIFKELTVDDGTEQRDREKSYLLTRTISLLNEGAALGQPIGMTEEDYALFDETMNETVANLGTLRTLLTDSVHIQGVDTITVLIEEKRRNTLQLYTIWKDMNTERLYSKVVKKNAADTLVTQVEIKEQVNTKKDSVLVPVKKKGFFKRLADAFVPPKEEVGIVVNTTSNVLTDTLVNIYNPTDTHAEALKELELKMSKERKDLVYKLYDKAAELKHNNALINTRINQILYAIEEQEMDASVDRLISKQKLFSDTSRVLAIVALIAILVVLVFSFLISRDISKSKYYRKQLEKAKQYAEELLVKQEKFMLAISHDIRAPLSSILGYLELLLRRNPDERQRYYLENMVSSSNHILSLVNDLLDFHRLDSGKMEIQNVAFHVKSLFDDIFMSFKPMADAKKLDFLMRMEMDDEDKAYLGDPIRIRQIVSNLLSNAIKFTAKGEILLSVSVLDNILHMAVQDTGQGIPEEEQDAVFGEFTRLKKESVAEGFGLGLSITQKLVKLMGGEISLESQVGQGSTFRVELPVEEVDKVVEDEGSESSTPTLPLNLDNREINCLLVDDDPLQLVLTDELLKQSSIHADTCSNPQEVLSLIQKKRYDLVITDIQMPGLDGFSLVSQIRSSGIAGTETLPVVALSASVANEMDVYLRAGFTGFLNKPFTASELMTLLNQLLSTDLKTDTSLNFSSLTDFAGDDPEALKKILLTFKDESAHNVQLLKQVLAGADRAQSAKIAHKMIPVFTMIGANHLVQRLRLLEKNDGELSDAGWKQLVKEVLLQIDVIMADVSTKIGEL